MSIQRKNFSSPDETKTPAEKVKIEVVTIGNLTLQLETLEPGWKWSEHVKPVVGGESCQKFHVKYIISGRQKVVMDDGTEMELNPGDVSVIHPGHNAWVVGDEPNVLLELSGAVKQPDHE